jgi:hypothetical protein
LLIEQPEQIMLETLDSVDWAKLHHSHGTGEKFPQWIRDLASDNDVIFFDAWNGILAYANHQGSAYEITPYVVPFILELLQAETISHKANLLEILASFAGADIFDPTPDTTILYHVEQNQKRAGQSKWYEAYKNTYENLRRGIDLYIPYLIGPQDHVCVNAFLLLTVFTEDYQRLRPILHSRLKSGSLDFQFDTYRYFAWFIIRGVASIEEKRQDIELLRKLQAQSDDFSSPDLLKAITLLD